MRRPGREAEVRDDPEHRVVLVAVRRRLPEQRVRPGAVADHRQRRQRHHGHPGVHAEHRDQDVVDRQRHVPARVARLLGHVRDGLDPGVGEHGQRQREDQMRVARRRAQVDLVDEQRRVQHEYRADADDQDLGGQVEHSEHEVEVRGLADPADVQPGEQRDHDQAADHVSGRMGQRLPERAQVVGHEERRDRDRQDVVEAEGPAGEERDQFVERVAGKTRRAARLREHRRALGVRLGRQGEQPTGQHEHHRREAQRVGGNQTQRVVDRRAHVAVGGREQAAYTYAAPQSMLLNPSHRPSSTVVGTPSRHG